MFIKRSFLIGIISCVLALTSALKGAVTPVIKAINVELYELTNVNKEVIYSHINLYPGSKYDSMLLDQSIHSLYETGLFNYIDVRLEPSVGGDEVDLNFIVVPRYVLKEVRFSGNKRFRKDTLTKKIKSKAGHRLDEAKIKQDTEALNEFYQKKGYSKVKIETELEKNDSSGTSKLTFKIEEGERLVIKRITFEGNNHITSKQLRKCMYTQSRGLFTIFSSKDRVQEEVIQKDLEALRNYYKDCGFLDIEIPDTAVVFEYPAKGQVTIKIKVQEGKRYSIGKVAIKYNTLFDTAVLLNLLTYTEGKTFSASGIENDAKALQDYYGRRGYLDASVQTDRIPNVETGNIDLEYLIQEGEKCSVESIRVHGNTITKTNVILREIALAPGDMFDLVKMRNSQARLENTRFFKEVTLTPESTNIPGRRNLKINVKEGKSGSINFGGSFNNVAKGVLYVELNQSNFDLFNYKSHFRGAGQKFRVRFSVGQRSHDWLVHFEEPYLFERELAFGVEFYGSETNYESSIYNKLVTGLEVYFRKNLFELVEGRLYYCIEQIHFKNLKREKASEVILRDASGHKMLSKLGFELSRNTTDNFIYPNEGTRAEITTELAGGPVGGSINYIRLQGKFGAWIPTYSTMSQVLALVVRGGTLGNFNHKAVPFYERYYLGGPDDLRGFDYRKIGPRDKNGEPTGGLAFASATAEYAFKLHPIVRFVVFYDIGILTPDHKTIRGYSDDVGIGLRVFILNAPLRLDLGYPISRDNYNKKEKTGSVFNFSFGVAF